jgi:dTDP-L-rhamnose 4-epimerase
LITGGAGFVGSHTADQLAAQGTPIRLVDALLPAAHGGDAPAWTEPYEMIRDDLTDVDTVVEMLDGVDAVCHLAAMVGHGIDPSDAPEYVLNNDYSTAVLLAAMARTGIRKLVLASSMVVYGEGRYRCAEHGIAPAAPRQPVDLAAGRYDPPCPHCGGWLTPELIGEDAPVDPRSTYAATKLAQEHLCSAWARQTGGSVWALRYHNIYGPRMPRDTPYAGVASIFRSMLERGDAPTVLEDGHQRRDFVHVTDVAAANVLALSTPALEGRLSALNICSGTPHTVGEFATELAAAMRGPAPVIAGGARPGDVRHVTADPAKAREILGFTARTLFADGVASFATDPLREPPTASRRLAAHGSR